MRTCFSLLLIPFFILNSCKIINDHKSNQPVVNNENSITGEKLHLVYLEIEKNRINKLISQRRKLNKNTFHSKSNQLKLRKLRIDSSNIFSKIKLKNPTLPDIGCDLCPDHKSICCLNFANIKYIRLKKTSPLIKLSYIKNNATILNNDIIIPIEAIHGLDSATKKFPIKFKNINGGFDNFNMISR